MDIHILDTDQIPVAGSLVEANCGKRVYFYPIDARLDGGEVCGECQKLHRAAPWVSCKRTFALPDSRREGN